MPCRFFKKRNRSQVGEEEEEEGHFSRRYSQHELGWLWLDNGLNGRVRGLVRAGRWGVILGLAE